MKRYEVMHEVFNACSGKWEMDNSFTREIASENPEASLKEWFHDKLPSYQTEKRPDGILAFVLDPPQRERFLFSEL